MTYAEVLGRIVEAQAFLHQHMCPDVDPHFASTCLAASTLFGIADALDVLDVDPHDVRGAALAMHDRVCQSDECLSALEDPERVSATDHARRIQGRAAAYLRKFHSSTS